jgi:hypothetical protein
MEDKPLYASLLPELFLHIICPNDPSLLHQLSSRYDVERVLSLVQYILDAQSTNSAPSRHPVDHQIDSETDPEQGAGARSFIAL